MKKIALLVMVLLSPVAQAANSRGAIFFHPDGMGLNAWQAARYALVGPAGLLHWDRLPAIAIYTGTMTDNLVGTSHGGATVHAYGRKVRANSYGTNGGQPISNRHGFPGSLMQEAIARGLPVGVVQTGNISEPGTGVFLASSNARMDFAGVAQQVAESGADIILTGGEQWLLPAGQAGRFGPGARTDGRDLIAAAAARGYAVVYTLAELQALPAKTPKVLGVFAALHSFNDLTEEELRAARLPFYNSAAPSVAEMSAAALRFLETRDQPFLLVIEEEGTDNFANMNNAPGWLEAARRADAALGILADFVNRNPQMLLLTTADSEAGGLALVGPNRELPMPTYRALPAQTINGAPLDGRHGTGSPPFMSPARGPNGDPLPFGIAWASQADTAGGILLRGLGAGSADIRGVVDNTYIYQLMRSRLWQE